MNWHIEIQQILNGWLLTMTGFHCPMYYQNLESLNMAMLEYLKQNGVDQEKLKDMGREIP